MNTQEPKKRTKLVSLKFNNLIKYPVEGIKYAFKFELSMTIHVIITVLVSILGFLVKLSLTEWLLVLVMYGFVLGGELVNTAIEATVDLYTKKSDPRAMTAKDTASAMVLVFSISAAIGGTLIFAPKIINILF